VVLAVAEKLVELQPQDRAAAMQLLSAYEQAAQYDKAIALVSKLTERYPDAADTLTFRLAYLYIRSGQKEKAKEFAVRGVGEELLLGGEGPPRAWNCARARSRSRVALSVALGAAALSVVICSLLLA
jgi:tetratricopeptide (TPR) repeat protein